MNTVTIPKREYEALKKDAIAWRRVLGANGSVVPKGLSGRPNKETLRAIRGLRAGKGTVYTGSTKEIFDAIVKGR